MQLDYEIIISDTSCLILLFKIGELSLLNKLSEKVYITPIIKNEFDKKLPEWIHVKSPKNKLYQEILQMAIDPIEASAIALALELENSVLIIDDLKGRKIADKLKLKFSGTFGLLLKARQAGVINSVKPILKKIKKTDFRFSDDLFEFILKQAGE